MDDLFAVNPNAASWAVSIWLSVKWLIISEHMRKSTETVPDSKKLFVEIF